MPSFFRKKKNVESKPSTLKKKKDEEIFDESLLQLHQETNELLKLVNTPAKNISMSSPFSLTKYRKDGGTSSSPPKSMTTRVTIEVLDDEEDEEADKEGKAASSQSKSTEQLTKSFNPKDNGIQGALNPDDAFSFQGEENRVRRRTDTFYPDTVSTKKAVKKQVNSLMSEKDRLEEIKNAEIALVEKKVTYQQQAVLQDQMEESAIKIQAHSRGFLTRKHIEDDKQIENNGNIDLGSSQNQLVHWHEVRDVEKGEVWYYNSATGESQWDHPPGFKGSTNGSTNKLLPELQSSSFSSNNNLGRTSSGGGFSDLPPLSHASNCSSVRSSSGIMSDGNTSIRSDGQLQRLPVSGTSSIPNLPVLQRSGSNWECDSVNGTDSLCSERIDNDEEEEDEDPDGVFSKRREEADNGDWMDNDTLFLADGSRNSKLRDTIRGALKVSKFDSVSSLIASNVVLRRKTPKGSKTNDGSPVKKSNQAMASVERASRPREIVLGKKETNYFVAVLAKEDNKQRPQSKRTAGKQPRNSLTSPPRIRDLVDPGFHEDLRSTVSSNASSINPADSDSADTMSSTGTDLTLTVDSNSSTLGNEEEIITPRGSQRRAFAPANTTQSNSAGGPTVCFSCWSSSKGRYCDVHRDPNEHRKIHASESALMCSNWELDELRRKYRAEEIQEIFMKQNASLRYDKKLKQYVSVIECRHPIYRTVNALSESWNKTMIRKIHTRSWFRSFLEHLRGGRVPKADPSTPKLMKLRNTIQNNRWCIQYADSVREFHPKASITQKNQSGRGKPIIDIIMIDPANPQIKNWILVTEHTKPVELYKPRKYELPPRRCIPIPTPSYLEDIPLPVPNVYIDSGHILSWFERLASRIAGFSFNKAMLQIGACSPPVGFTDARRTKHVTPLTVMFATFGRKSTKGNLAVGGLTAELLIHMLVTTYVPAQFGNFIVFDRRAITPMPVKDHDALYLCFQIDPTTLEYVFRPLEHALNSRRPPSILLATRNSPLDQEDPEENVVESEEAQVKRKCKGRVFPPNRPEQTGEERPNGFRTFFLVDAFVVFDAIESVEVLPNSNILSFNTTSMNITLTTKVDRYYPFCIPTTKENTPIEFIHLLWIGQSSRNQAQVFTSLGAQQPGEFMKNSNPGGALGVCTSVIYRSWAYQQASPYEEFITDDGIAYWYDKNNGETFWTRPVLQIEKYRGKDGEIDGVIVDGIGEKATLGVGADDARYSQQTIRKYMAKSIEEPEEKEKRLKQVQASAKKHDIVVQLASNQPAQANGGGAIASNLRKATDFEKVQVPKLTFKKEESNVHQQQKSNANMKPATTNSGLSPTKLQQHCQQQPVAGVANPALETSTKQLIETITQALGSALPALSGGNGSVDMLQLGIGLGMGLGLRTQQQQSQGIPSFPVEHERPTTAMTSSTLTGRFESMDEDMMSSRSDMSDMSLTSARSMASTVTIDFSPTPDEAEMNLDDSQKAHPGAGKKVGGYVTHLPPGEGRTWVDKPIDGSAASQTAVEGFGGTLHKRVACLPKNFVEAVNTTKTCKMQANYLPVVKNINESRSVGIVRPRTSFEEWSTVNYSPWSAGRSTFGTQFIRDLLLRTDISTANQSDDSSTKKSALEEPGQVEKREDLTPAMKEAQQLEQVLSLCRHGKYEELETLINQPDWRLNIDTKDSTGNTLLSVACQNNNKRIAKLCLRRGADINTQNLNGQTVLHYCHEYGFHDLMDYLMSKGARDDIVNADGLTCYEGLTKEAVDAI